MSDQIKLELKGHNHPFAYLIQPKGHTSTASGSLESIPKDKALIQNRPRLSEDPNVGRHLKNVTLYNN